MEEMTKNAGKNGDIKLKPRDRGFSFSFISNEISLNYPNVKIPSLTFQEFGFKYF